MTGLKLLGAAAPLQSPRRRRKRFRNPAPLVSTIHLSITSRAVTACVAPRAGNTAAMTGSNVIVTIPNAYAYYDAGCVPGTWHVGADGLRRFCR